MKHILQSLYHSSTFLIKLTKEIVYIVNIPVSCSNTSLSNVTNTRVIVSLKDLYGNQLKPLST